MALRTEDLLLKLNPVGSLGGGQDGSMERQRLKLMREQFENQKKQQEEANALLRMRESGEMARAQLQHQSQMDKLDAEQAAATKASKMDAYKKFTELNGSGDIEGARAMVPMMSALGMGVDLEGEEGGLPRYRIEMDDEKAALQEAEQDASQETYGKNETAQQSLSRLDTMGLGNESGTLDAPAGIASSDQVDASGLSVAERLASTYGDPGEKTAMAPPGEADYTGGVPKNVLDMGAISSQARARLDPALKGMIEGLPPEYQDSARSTASGIGGLGLPAAKAAEMYGKQQGDANTLITGGLNRAQEDEQRLEAAAKEAYTARTGADAEGYKRFKDGSNVFAKEIGDQFDVKSRNRARSLYSQALGILKNDTQEDDLLVLALIARSFGERGATSEGDTAKALGLPATSTWDQVTDWFQSRMEGGMAESSKRALIGVLTNSIKNNDGELETYSKRLLEMADDPGTDPDVARGVRQYWRSTVPDELKAKYKSQAKATGGDAGRVASGEASAPGELAFLVDAEAGISGLNPAAINQVIQLESGGNPAARNPSGATGLIQFMPQTAKNLGTTTEEIATMPLEDQVRLVVKYFENSGITADSPPDDYAVAVAAPAFVGKPDETVVYKEGSAAWEQNKPWRPEGGGDITVGSIKAAYRKKGVGAEPASAEPAATAPAAGGLTPEERAELAELKKRLGR